MNNVMEGSTVLITGGTGSFGRKCAEIILKKMKCRKLIIFSRDEHKQYEMSKELNSDNYDCKVSYYLGDIRDSQRLHRAFHGVDYVIHAAALKQVPSAEYNPDEAIKTNIMGTLNVINAAIDQKVKKAIALSTDKAVNPINLYGATKLCAEKLFVAGNSYVGDAGTRFGVVRYGNVLGSRGSIVPHVLGMKDTGVVPITDERMTRFWIKMERGVEFVLNCFERLHGGEIFVPKLPSMKVKDLLRVLVPDCEVQRIGIRPGEKIDECMITEDDSRHTLEYDDHYVVVPDHPWWNPEHRTDGSKLPEDFRYDSANNTEWLSDDSLREMISSIS